MLPSIAQIGTFSAAIAQHLAAHTDVTVAMPYHPLPGGRLWPLIH